MEMANSSDECYSAAVIGAGPAGLAVVARLLDAGASRVMWVDPAFQGGRLAVYPEVPSNTKVALFLQYARVSETLAALIPKCAASQVLVERDQDKGCPLECAQKLCADLAAALITAHPDRLSTCRAWVKRVRIDRSEQLHELYTLDCHSGVVDKFDSWVPPGIVDGQALPSIVADSLYLCTGAAPIPQPPIPPHEACNPDPARPIQLLDLDLCLRPTALRKALAGTPNPCIAVVGSSHSAILCVRNAAIDSVPGARVVNFWRHPLKYAVYMSGEDGNWILYDNTGLKGEAADWARANLEAVDAAAKLNVTRVQLPSGADAEAEAYRQYLKGVTHIVYAIGYRPRPLPGVILDDMLVAPADIAHDKKTGRITVGGVALQQARGFGIAFPEEVTDRYGNVELSVGMWKFMRYVRDVMA